MIVQDGFVPVIDLGGEPGTVAAAIDATCRSSGFHVVTGHGVDPDLIDRLHDVTLQLFQQPAAWKDQWSCDLSSPTLRGMFRTASRVSASEDLDTAPDLCELFTMSRLGEPGVAASAELGDAQAVWSEPNRWPDRPAGLRDVWLAYYAAMEGLATRLMRLFAIGLGLPSTAFDAMIDEHITNMVANYYPPVHAEPLADQYRKGPHSDWGTLTILYQDGTGGLEVFDQGHARWMDVPVIPGAYVVNVGDLMARWTNDSWRSTKHRVRVPPPDKRATDRVSVAFFHHPNWSAVIECLPTCTTAERPARYPPVTAGDYLLGKIAAVYT